MATFYLSSTIRDLEECRKKVAETLRQLGHTVVGMEDYTADSRPPLQKVLADIAECDAYLGLFAWRYGYIPKKDNPRKLAFTELEYREAVRLQKHPLIFILSEDAHWPVDQIAQDDKERRQIKALREKLSQDHNVKFFRDCNDLATKVSIAVSRPIDKEPKPIPPPPTFPPSPTPRPWKWYALAVIVTVVLVSVAYGIKVASRRNERMNDWSSRFNKTEKLAEHWQYPKDLWKTEPGELQGDDEALLVKGQEMGIPSDLGGKVFRNFRANFKIRFKNGGDRAAWVLRAQPDRAGGYLFELVREGTHLFLYSWIYDRKQKVENLRKDEVPFGRFRESKSLTIDVVVEDNKFNYNMIFRDDEPDDPPAPGEPKSGATVVENLEISDDPDNIRWQSGTIGFLETDDTSVMRVESVYVFTPKP